MSQSKGQDLFFHRPVGPDLPTLRTALSLQRHQEWVSQPDEEIPGLVAAAGFSLLGKVINPVSTGGQAYVAMRQHLVVVAFRGSGGDTLSETALNVLADINALRVRPREIAPNVDKSVRVHRGFYENYLAFRDQIHKRIATVAEPEIYVTGFSLGSALATLCALDLTLNRGHQVTLHGAGTPRVGNKAFVRLMAQRVPHTLRTVLASDPVSRVPLQAGTRRTFHHVGDLLELDLGGDPVCLENLDSRFPDRPQVGDHNRDKYASALRTIIGRLEKRPRLLHEIWGDEPLRRAADHERGFLDWLTDDDEEDD